MKRFFSQSYKHGLSIESLKGLKINPYLREPKPKTLLNPSSFLHSFVSKLLVHKDLQLIDLMTCSRSSLKALALEKEVEEDAQKLADSYLKEIISIGAYSHSKGIIKCRENLASYLSRRDAKEYHPKYIFMMENTLAGISLFLTTLKGGQKDAVIFERPISPNYGRLAKHKQITPFYFDSENDSTSMQNSLLVTLNEVKEQGLNPKFLIISHPNKVSGRLHTEEEIKFFLDLASKEKLTIFVDESSHQLASEEEEFKSFFSMMRDQQLKKDTGLPQLVSILTCSRSIFPELGISGSAFHVANFEEEVIEELTKMCSISLCSSTVGQVNTDFIFSHSIHYPDLQKPSIDLIEKEKKNNLNIISGNLRRLEKYCELAKFKMIPSPFGTSVLVKTNFSERNLSKFTNKDEPMKEYSEKMNTVRGIEFVPGSWLKMNDDCFKISKVFYDGDEVLRHMLTVHAEYF